MKESATKGSARGGSGEEKGEREREDDRTLLGSGFDSDVCDGTNVRGQE